MIGLLLTVLVAALVYLLLAAITGSAIVAIVGAILVLIAGIPTRRLRLRQPLRRPRQGCLKRSIHTRLD